MEPIRTAFVHLLSFAEDWPTCSSVELKSATSRWNPRLLLEQLRVTTPIVIFRKIGAMRVVGKVEWNSWESRVVRAAFC